MKIEFFLNRLNALVVAQSSNPITWFIFYQAQKKKRNFIFWAKIILYQFWIIRIYKEIEVKRK